MQCYVGLQNELGGREGEEGSEGGGATNRVRAPEGRHKKHLEAEEKMVEKRRSEREERKEGSPRETDAMKRRNKEMQRGGEGRSMHNVHCLDTCNKEHIIHNTPVP